MDRAFRKFGRGVGACLLPIGLFLFIAPMTAKLIGFEHFLAILVGLALSVLGFFLSGLSGVLAGLWRKLAIGRLSRRLTAQLGSAAEPSPEHASIRWLGTRNGHRVALFWTLDLPSTQASIILEGGAPGTMRIIPNLSRGGRLIGGRTIRTGHDQFDAVFLARSEPVTLIGDVFADGRLNRVAEAIMNVPEGQHGRVILTLSDLRIRIPRILGSREELEKILAAAETVAGAVREAARRAGYSELKVGEGTTGKCPICVALLETEVVLCIRCRTPHHQDCWEYARECATFACGGRRWIPA